MKALGSPLSWVLLLVILSACVYQLGRKTSLQHDRLTAPIYEHLRSTNIKRSRGPNDVVNEIIDGQFYYPSTSAFVTANPGCCEFMTKDDLNISIPLWVRITGKAVSFIKVSYRPTDQAGRPISGASQKVRWLEVSHDGKIADRRQW